MVIGADWAGARAFTSTAGPGISLMQEFIGLAYYTETPAVFFDVQRTGPVHRDADAHAAGRPAVDRVRVARRHEAHHALSRRTRRSASTMAVRGVRPRRAVPDAGVRRVRSRHRDERLDGASASTWDDDFRPDRGKVLGAAELEKLKKFSRYLDVDGDGIAARTLPGRGRRRAPTSRAARATTSTARTPRIRRVSGSRRSHRAQDANGGEGRAGAGDRSRREHATIGDHLARRLPRRGARGGATCCARRAWRCDYMRIRAFPFDGRGRRRSSKRTRRCSSSSRTATRSCARCSPSRPASRATDMTPCSTTAASRSPPDGRAWTRSANHLAKAGAADMTPSPNRRSGIRGSGRTRSG